MDLFVGYREVFDPSGHDNQFSLLKMHFGVALLDQQLSFNREKKLVFVFMMTPYKFAFATLRCESLNSARILGFH